MAKRDLLVRTLSGTVFIAVLVTGLVWCPSLLPFIVLTSLYFMFSEFFGISLGTDFRFPRLMAALTGVMLFCVSYCVCSCGMEARWFLLCVAPVLAMMISLLFARERPDITKFSLLFESIVYIGVPVALVPVLLFKDGARDGFLLLSFLVIMCCSDTGAYVFGSAFGQKPESRKLAPSISPKKSWVGFWSGVFVAMAVSVALHFLGWLDLPLGHCVGFASVLSVTGVCGDLFESLWKRHFGVKDSGNAIPGHGGFLDRFDSSLFAIPAAVVYLAVFNLL